MLLFLGEKETVARKTHLGSGVVLLEKLGLFFHKAFQCWLSQQQHQLAHGKKLLKC